MKLQKVALILGLSVCIAGTQVQMTFGLEEPAIEEHQDSDQASNKDKDKEKSEDEELEDKDKESEESSEEQKDQEESQDKNSSSGQNDIHDQNAQSGSGTNQDAGKKPENSGSTDNKNEEGKPGTDENEGNKTEGSTDVEKPDNGDNTEDNKGDSSEDNTDQPDKDDNKDDSAGGNADANQPDKDANKDDSTGGNADTSQPDKDNNKDDNTEAVVPVPEEPEKEEPATDIEQPAPPAENEYIEENAGSDTQDIYYDSGAESSSDNSYNTYSASIKFLDDSEKIKYNVSVPIKGLPSFITQEMIVAALKCQDETGYPASVTIAQIIQESGFGKYGPGGEDGKGLSYLAYQYNNLFGIKGTGPAGSVDMITGEQSKDGSMFTIVSGFRVYDTYTECIEERTELLKEVYSDLTFGVEDANTFAMKIGSRWATSLTYGQSLIWQMEKYDLYRLDKMTLGEFSNLLGTFVNPCPGAVLTSNFGYRDEPIAGAGNGHNGIDLGTGEYNIPTYAAAAGTVIYAGEAGTAGNLIIIDHGKGLVTKYMHHEKIFVEKGQKVEKGQQIGLSGTTGMSTGNHLHFQVEKNGTPVDPMQFFTEKQQESFNK